MYIVMMGFVTRIVTVFENEPQAKNKSISKIKYNK